MCMILVKWFWGLGDLGTSKPHLLLLLNTNRGSRVRFSAGTGNVSLHNRVQNGSEAHPASYSMGTKGSFTEVKAAGAW